MEIINVLTVPPVLTYLARTVVLVWMVSVVTEFCVSLSIDVLRSLISALTVHSVWERDLMLDV